MSVYKFGQIEVKAKEFNSNKQISDIFSLDYNKIVVSDAILCNKNKDKIYLVGYQTNEGIMPLYIKTPKNVFTNGVTQYNENSKYTMGFDLERI